MRDKIESLVAEELARASEKFPQFASHHEAWAVTYEELEEAIDEVKKLQESQLEILWQQVRSNSVDRFDLRVSTGTTIALIERDNGRG